MLEDFKSALQKLDAIEERYNELNERISDPAILNDQNAYKTLTKEVASIEETVVAYREMKERCKQCSDAEELLQIEKDPEILKMAQEELALLKEQIEKDKENLKMLLIPPDPLAGKNIIVEIRAGTGGEEAALFAMELYRMYSRYAEVKGWKTEIIDCNETELGGVKEIIFNVAGKNVYEHLRYESGGHRVQRIPETESGGRVHTSAVTVAVLPEMEEADVEIRQEDLRIDVLRAGGAGGQHVNKTESAVRITHLPTGIVVKCEDQRSQHQNKASAMKVLLARLYEKQQSELMGARAEMRKNQVGSGDRSDKVRTYNFPQNRVTDHRVNVTLYKLDQFMEGNIDEIIEALKLSAREAQLLEENL